MAKERLPLVINGEDFSEAASRLAYEIVYEERTGENTMYMLNGDEYPDVLDERPVITWPLNALWADELSRLLGEIKGGDYLPVTYFDTATGREQTGYFRGTLSPQRPGLYDRRGLMFRGMTLTLRSR